MNDNQRNGGTDFVVIQVDLGGILNKTYALPGRTGIMTTRVPGGA